MKIPKEINELVADLISEFGNNVEYLGRYKSKEVFHFVFPADMELGFPVVLTWDGYKAEELSPRNALSLVSFFCKN